MAAQLDEKDVFDALRDSSAYMAPLFEPLDEYDRIARNKPHPNTDKSYPKVTDGSTSAIINKTPRRIIQQLPSGTITSDADDWLSLVAGFCLTNIILPNCNEDFALLQKDWLVVKKALTFGSQPAYVPLVFRGDYFGPDMTIPFIKDVLYQPGKNSDLASNYVFMRSWWQTSDIEGLIQREKRLEKKATERKEKYVSEWDLSALESIKKEITAKNSEDQAPSEKARDYQASGVEIMHCFQRGVGSEFFSFHPKTKKIVRTKKNKDPRGDIPLISMYSDTDGSNPLGWGLAEQLAPMQNLMDAELQMYQFEKALGLQPPTIKRGTWNKSQAKLIPNALIDLGTNPGNSWEVLKRDTNALAQFAANYGLMKSQLLNLASSPDTSISSEIGNPGFSKTDSGVKQLAQNVSVDDNFVSKQYATFKERWSETAINLYFAERTGIQEIQLDKATASKVRELNPGAVSDDNKVRIDFDTETQKLKFEVDASSSRMKDNSVQLEALDGLLTRLEKSTVLQGIIPQRKIVGAWNRIVAASGVEDPEDMSLSDEELDQMEAEQQAQAEAQAAQQQQQMQAQAAQQEQMAAQQSQPPMEQMPQQPQIDPEDAAFIQELQALGYDEARIQQAMQMLAADLPEEQIINAIGPA